MKQNVKSLSDIDARIITKDALQNYRYAPQGIKVILDATEILKSHYNGDVMNYINEAEKHHTTNFRDDPFLGVKFIKWKTRDMALSFFSTKFIALDVHIIRFLFRTGLVLESYSYEFPPISNIQDGNVYNDIRSLCFSLAKQIPIELSAFDRMLWNFGRTVCAAKPKCSDCPINDLCVLATTKKKSLGVSVKQQENRSTCVKKQ